jgi:hypothetical protein
MSRKPRIHRDCDGWRITRPGYGFRQAETLGPFDSHAAAVAALAKTSAVASAGASTVVASQPHASQYRWRGHTLYPMKIT